MAGKTPSSRRTRTPRQAAPSAAETVRADVVSYGVLVDATTGRPAGGGRLTLVQSSLDIDDNILRHCLPLVPLGLDSGNTDGQDPRHAGGTLVVYPLWRSGEERPFRVVVARLGKTRWREESGPRWASLVHALVVDASTYEKYAPRLIGALAAALVLEPVTNAIPQAARLSLPPAQIPLAKEPTSRSKSRKPRDLATWLAEGRMVGRAMSDASSAETVYLAEIAAALADLPAHARATVAFGVRVPRACAGLDVCYGSAEGRSAPASVRGTAAPWRGGGMASLASEESAFFNRIRAERRAALTGTVDHERANEPATTIPDGILLPDDVEHLLQDRRRLTELADAVGRGEANVRDHVLVSAIVARHSAPERPDLPRRLLEAVTPTQGRHWFTLARLDEDIPLLQFALQKVEQLVVSGARRRQKSLLAVASDRIGQAITQAAPPRKELSSRRRPRRP